jgi:hypothetical protein
MYIPNRQIMTDVAHDNLPILTDSPVDPYEGMNERERQRTDYMNKFNAIMLGIFEHVTQFYANVEVENAKEQITDVLIESPDGPICCFLKYVYLNDTYRRHLTEMNESFFLDSQRIADPEVAKDQAIIDKIFSFKKIWVNFADDTKNFIMRSLRGLVRISTRYIEYMD